MENAPRVDVFVINTGEEMIATLILDRLAMEPFSLIFRWIIVNVETLLLEETIAQ